MIKHFHVNRNECNDLACQIFMQTSGIDREGRKFERMKKDAFRMRKLIEDRVRIRVAYAWYDKVELSGREAVIGGERFYCSAFEQVDPNAVKGSYVYALSVGDFGLPEEPIMDQLYADIWGSAFTDAARFLLKHELEKKVKLSDSFGPGFYGMDVSQMQQLASLLSFDDLDMELRNSQILVPLKSCAGLYFSVTDEYKKLNRECENCRGTHTSCKLCQIHGGIANV